MGTPEGGKPPAVHVVKPTFRRGDGAQRPQYRGAGGTEPCAFCAPGRRLTSGKCLDSFPRRLDRFLSSGFLHFTERANQPAVLFAFSTFRKRLFSFSDNFCPKRRFF